jgi:hypothetical protein
VDRDGPHTVRNYNRELRSATGHEYRRIAVGDVSDVLKRGGAVALLQRFSATRAHTTGVFAHAADTATVYEPDAKAVTDVSIVEMIAVAAEHGCVAFELVRSRGRAQPGGAGDEFGFDILSGGIGDLPELVGIVARMEKNQKKHGGKKTEPTPYTELGNENFTSPTLRQVRLTDVKRPFTLTELRSSPADALMKYPSTKKLMQEDFKCGCGAGVWKWGGPWVLETLGAVGDPLSPRESAFYGLARSNKLIMCHCAMSCQQLKTTSCGRCAKCGRTPMRLLSPARLVGSATASASSPARPRASRRKQACYSPLLQGVVRARRCKTRGR